MALGLYTRSDVDLIFHRFRAARIIGIHRASTLKALARLVPFPRCGLVLAVSVRASRLMAEYPINHCGLALVTSNSRHIILALSLVAQYTQLLGSQIDRFGQRENFLASEWVVSANQVNHRAIPTKHSIFHVCILPYCHYLTVITLLYC